MLSPALVFFSLSLDCLRCCLLLLLLLRLLSQPSRIVLPQAVCVASSPVRLTCSAASPHAAYSQPRRRTYLLKVCAQADWRKKKQPDPQPITVGGLGESSAVSTAEYEHVLENGRAYHVYKEGSECTERCLPGPDMCVGTDPVSLRLPAPKRRGRPMTG